MSLPALPTEIHELIIDSIAAFAPIDRRKALSTCALVCASWHSFVLRHTFQTIRLPSDVMTGGALPSTIILRLMEANPEIRRCVKSLYLNFPKSGAILPAFIHDAFEQVCRLCTAVSYLSIDPDIPNLDSSPLIRSGIYLLLNSPSLHKISSSFTFRSSFLLEAAAASRNLQLGLADMSFTVVKKVVLDHEDADLAKFSGSLLPSVKFWCSDILISTIQQTPGLSQLFERTQHFHIILNPESLRSATLWNRDLTWGNCTSMEMKFGFLAELHQGFFSYCEDFPWSSLIVLKSLKITLLLGQLIQTTGNIEADAVMNPTWIPKCDFPLFLSGPSRLKTLENLCLIYSFMVFRSRARVDQTFRELFRDSLDRNFRRGSGLDVGLFPNLGTFDFDVQIIGAPEVFGVFGASGMEKEVVEQEVKIDIEKCLPSVFGLGGRCEVNGWAASVDVNYFNI